MESEPKKEGKEQVMRNLEESLETVEHDLEAAQEAQDTMIREEHAKHALKEILRTIKILETLKSSS